MAPPIEGRITNRETSDGPDQQFLLQKEGDHEHFEASDREVSVYYISEQDSAQVVIVDTDLIVTRPENNNDKDGVVQNVLVEVVARGQELEVKGRDFILNVRHKER